jgi:hypothetical protein
MNDAINWSGSRIDTLYKGANGQCDDAHKRAIGAVPVFSGFIVDT